MNECRECNYSSEAGICLHESARDPSGTRQNITTYENRAANDSTHCGREGRFWQPIAIPAPPPPNA